MGTLASLLEAPRRAQGRLGRPGTDSIRTRSPRRERTQTKLESDNREPAATTVRGPCLARMPPAGAKNPIHGNPLGDIHGLVRWADRVDGV